MNFSVVIAGTVSAIGSWMISRHAEAMGLEDRPNARSSHKTPTPRGGGVGLLLAWMVTGLVLRPPIVLWAGGCAMSILGLWDDLRNLPARGRLLAQFGIATVLMGAGNTAGLTFSALPAGVFIVVFLVGTTNFFNFMDGINGIAGIMGFVSLGLIAVMTWGEASPIPKIASTMAGACIGFLPFNFPRARVFMGDVGSLLTGFLYAVLVVMAATDFSRFLCLVSFQFLFYADTLTTLFIRWRSGEHLAQAHRRHLYQVLANELGAGHAKVASFYGGVQATLGVLMIAAWHIGFFWECIVFSSACLVYIAVMLYFRRMAALVTHR